jgi:hypothetical protein
VSSLRPLAFNVYDDGGQSVNDQVPWLIIRILAGTFPTQAMIHDPIWESAKHDAIANKRTPILSELVLNARAFYRSRDYTMSFLLAAIACERALADVVREKLESKMGVARNDAKTFTEKVSKRQLPKLLGFLCDLDASLADDLMAKLIAIFEERNRIAHGQQRYPVPKSRADVALNVVSWVAGLQRSEPVLPPSLPIGPRRKLSLCPRNSRAAAAATVQIVASITGVPVAMDFRATEDAQHAPSVPIHGF